MKPKVAADASEFDDFVTATDNVGPSNYPDPPQDPGLEDEADD